MTKYLVMMLDDKATCPECGYENEDHHVNCPIGRIPHAVVDSTQINPQTRNTMPSAL